MEGNNDKFTLTFSQFENALTIVNKEKLTKLFTRRHKIALQISIASACVIILCYVIGFYYTSLLKILNIIIASFSIILIASTILNLPLIIKLMRYYFRIRRLGLTRVLIAPWRKERSKTRALNILDGFITILGFIIILLMIIMGFYVIRSYFLYPSITDEMHRDYLELILALIMGISVGISFISIRFVRMILSRLKVINRIQKSLLSYKNKLQEENIDEFAIPLEDYKLIAKIERAQIVWGQAKSILDYRDNNGASHYTIQKSQEFKKAWAVLSKSLRLTVEEQIDELLNNFNSKRSTEISKTEKIQHKIPDKSMELEYQVDVNRKNIKLIDLVKQNRKRSIM